ncbi:helix-turn-helix transcriptional regulator [Paenibacillus sacheonensis]|uniref:Helix-turn-helix domain-containing protein n=1 Tax=Paenibacillus sacheonensis TaxID=742054 RepID=A0A7X4YS48_9BACL|nr:helix-turn-helix domain-containing protein [Paenibacillus sacheonensis]MBM7566918.1 AraC-like DNA-binding protein [Paenibacillus sacheonensis]NBC71540.1 helix-turn-helix domain-containing protein [Paenibacillus sacheonensis]
MFRNHLTLPLQSRGRFYCFPESAGHYLPDRGHESYREAGSMQEFNLHLVVDGSGYLEIEGQRKELTAGDCFLYFPGDRQAYFAHPEHPWEFKWIHFYGSAALADLAERGFHRSVPWRLRHSSELESRIDELLAEIERHKMLHPSRIAMLMYGVLAEFIEQAEPMDGAGTGTSSAVERMMALLPELQASAAEPFDLDAWAARAATNRYTFCRWFRRAVGQTPLAFLTMCRIQRAKALLVERPELSIGDIARLSGYDTPSYFNKRFQESENMTPTAYRQQFAGMHAVRT